MQNGNMTELAFCATLNVCRSIQPGEELTKTGNCFGCTSTFQVQNTHSIAKYLIQCEKLPTKMTHRREKEMKTDTVSFSNATKLLTQNHHYLAMKSNE